ncbi:hypothetical protein NECAME_18189 [Necator americanus]|uniref:Uncharacterized protein n=1 Tax=Necator americanus TaxID=51031 RepID=W2T9C9_NECAM|nr:hypothetical protein NECAME_18189 [Necator americanus]ETN78635.1 hypothetical protein NECAME_18189 [Necator americanus]
MNNRSKEGKEFCLLSNVDKRTRTVGEAHSSARMSSYLLFAILLGLAGLTSAIKCYLGTPDAQGKVQNTTECPGKFCVM